MGLNFGLGFWKTLSGGGGGGINTGRTASGFSTKASTMSVGFTGSAPASGTWIVLVIGENTAVCTVSNGTGATWSTLYSNTGNGCHVFYKKCNGSEPTTYTITYNGISSGDTCTAGMLEVLHANTTNPDASASTVTGTQTVPTITASASDLVVLTEIHFAGSSNRPPGGYSTKVAINDTALEIYVNISTNIVSAGTVSPGNYSQSTSLLGIIGFKP